MALDIKLFFYIENDFLNLDSLLFKLIFLLSFFILIKYSLALKLFWNKGTILPKGALDRLLIKLICLLSRIVRKFKSWLLFLKRNQSMWEAIRVIIPDSFRLKIHGDNMPRTEKMFECISLWIPSTSNIAADHTDPLVFCFMTMIALQVDRMRVYNMTCGAHILFRQ